MNTSSSCYRVVGTTGVENKVWACMVLELGVVQLDVPEGGKMNLKRREGRGDRPHDGTSRLGIEFEGIVNQYR